jgi:uncharacterized protein
VLLSTLLVMKLESPWFRVAFSVILGTMAIYVAKRNEILAAERAEPPPGAIRWAIAASIAAAFVASLLGIGGGAFHVPILILILGVPIHRATATSQFVLFLTSMAAATSLLLKGQCDLVYATWLGIGVLVGAQLGARVAPLVKATALKKGFAVVVLGTSAAMMWDGVKKLLGKG